MAKLGDWSEDEPVGNGLDLTYDDLVELDNISGEMEALGAEKYDAAVQAVMELLAKLDLNAGMSAVVGLTIASQAATMMDLRRKVFMAWADSLHHSCVEAVAEMDAINALTTTAAATTDN